MDEGERGDDEDDAGRCRSDARGQPSTAFVAAERVGGTVARAGVDIARLREKSFRECPRLSLPEMEGASDATSRKQLGVGKPHLVGGNHTRAHQKQIL